jgi:hypothetical protein
MTTTVEVTKSNKSFVPWTDGGRLPLDGLFVRHTLSKGSSNGYMWDEGFTPGKETLAKKNITEYDTGVNTVQVYCNINSVLYRSDELKPKWIDNGYPTVWVNFYTRDGNYSVALSLDGSSNWWEAKLWPV